MRKRINKLKLKYERLLISKVMRLKQENKQLRKMIEGLKEENHKLIDEITLKQIKIRELSIEK